jgi:hypothetical protein
MTFLIATTKNAILLIVATERKVLNVVLNVIIKNVFILSVVAPHSIFVIYHALTRQKNIQGHFRQARMI